MAQALSPEFTRALNALYSLHPSLIDLSTGRVLRFLQELGDPHLSIPPVIHVAGTNGKGSTLAGLRAILEAHGKRCHVAISPHLVRINERITLAGEEISDAFFAALIDEAIAANKGQDITFFEMVIAITFMAFSRVEADFCLIETGLGGRLDATNVVPDPAATIITSISMDHQQHLGDTLSKIAFEKAGIMKRCAPCILGPMPGQDVEQVFLSQASSTGAILHRYGPDWRVSDQGERFVFQDATDSFTLPKPALIGPHQIYNIGSAIAALHVINGLTLDPQKLSAAMGRIHWPGRLQNMGQSAWMTHCPAGASLWLDGGHNEAAGHMLAQQIKIWRNSSRPVHLIFGMMRRKDPLTFIAPMAEHLSSITCIPINGHGDAFAEKELRDMITGSGIASCQVRDANTPEAALLGIKDENAHILITGSLYLAGQILEKA